MDATAVNGAEADSRSAADWSSAAVSVVICTYSLERWDDLQRAVTSVLAQQPGPAELIIVVDHNVSLMNRARTRWKAPVGGVRGSVRVIANDRRPGLAGARNAGVALASSPIVAFLDDDAQAEQGWIQRLSAAYDDPHVVACGGAVVPRLTAPRPSWWPVEFDWVVGCSHAGLPTTTGVVRNLIGANMSIRRDALVAAGGFAEGIGRVGSIPLGCEETDLCIRLVDNDPSSTVVYDPCARVSHRVPRERLTWRYFHARCYAEGVSKARVSARVGAKRALSCERTYVRTVLLRQIGRSVLGCRRDGRGLMRALTIVIGLFATTAGYLVERAHGIGLGERRGLRLPMATTKPNQPQAAG